MRLPTLRPLLWTLAFAATTTLAAGPDDTFLPTPYSAEQIRDAWQEGLRVVTRVTTPAGVSHSATTVTTWSAAEVTISDQPLDESGGAAGEPTEGTATWIDLRDHARFPAATAERHRATVETPLGTLDGWRYISRGEDGAVDELFFADATPGPPVIFTRKGADGATLMTAEVVEHQPPTPEE